MTMHDCLKFLDAMHSNLERNSSDPGPWCWPTRDLVNRTLMLNRKKFPRDAKVSDSWKRQLGIALRYHWMAAGPCQPHCHAQHLSLTAAGVEALKLMNDKGCGPDCAVSRGTKFHFERRVA